MVLEIDKACRLCLDLSSHSLFYDVNSTGHPKTLDENLISKIFECTSLKIAAGDGLPESVCGSCLRLVDKFVLFRKMCWEVDDKLKQYLFSDKDGDESLVSSLSNPVRLDEDQQELSVQVKDSWMCDSSQIKGEQETSDDEVENGNMDDNDESDEDYFPSASRSKRQHTCDTCDESFARIAELKIHKEEEHPATKKAKPVMICSYCNKSFKQLKRFKDHIKTHEEPAQDKEDGVNEKSANDSDSDSSPPPPRLSVKNEANNESSQSRTAGGNAAGTKKKKLRKVYDCEYCDLVFNSHAKYTQHELTHTGEKKYNCSDCSRSFTHKHSLIGHIKEQHTGEVNFTCDVCGRGFVHQSTFNIHKKTHSTEKPLKCPDCDKCFTQMKNLRVHRQIHTASRSHTCQVCGKSFNFLKTLKVHLILHSGEKPYVCTYCGKAFAQSAPLKTHTRIHTGEKPYLCTVCPLRFSTNNALKSHVLKHSGGAPYSCSVCNKGFNRKKDMVAHQEEMHGVYIGLPGQQNHQLDMNSMPSQNNLQDTVMQSQQNCMQMQPPPLVAIPSMLIVPDLVTDHIPSHHSPPPHMSLSVTPQHHHPHMTHNNSPQLHQMTHHSVTHLAPPTNCMPHPSSLYNNPPQLRADLPGTDCSGG